MNSLRRASFVVRVVQNGRGEVQGVIECVATGGKEAFTSVEAIGEVIARMLRQDAIPPRGVAGPAPPTGQPTANRRT